MNWIGFVACIAAWAFFVQIGNETNAQWAFWSAVICSLFGTESLIKIVTKKDD